MPTRKPLPATRPVSLRIDPQTRASLDYIIERTGLKSAQVIRLAIKQAEERIRSAPAAAPKAARTTR